MGRCNDLSDFGVPDDEMSGSFPFDDEGPDPYLGQDLDGLLSGENRRVPEPLRPVVLALDALRAAPTRAELLGEEAARSYFRKVIPVGDDSGPPRRNAGAGEARTRILPTGRPGGVPDRARRRHRHRRPSRRGHWQVKAGAGVAAAVVIVTAAALAGAFSRSGAHLTAAGAGPGVTGATTLAPGQGAHGVDGSGKPEPSVKPTPKATSSRQSGNGRSPQELCSEYFLPSPAGQVTPVTRREIYRQLNSLAGGQGDILPYCLSLPQPWAAAQGSAKIPGGPGYSSPGGLPGQQDPRGPQDAQGSHSSQGSPGTGLSPGHGGNRANGDGHGGNGPAFGTSTSGR